MTVGQRIAQKRKELGLSQEALGEQLGVSRQSIYKWESDTVLPEVEKLIALSRLFSVPVGWLLGVEDAAPETSEAATELTDAQLAMVKEIVEQYLAAREEATPPRKVWPRVLAGLGAAVLVAVLFSLSGQLNQAKQTTQDLQSSVLGLQNSISSQVGSIYDRMQALLQEQNDLTAQYDTQHLSNDLEANTATFSVYAVPKTYQPGMAAVFRAHSGEEIVEMTVAQPDGDNAFAGELTCPLTDEIILSVVFRAGDTEQTQVLDVYSDLYSYSFPFFYGIGFDHGEDQWYGDETQLVLTSDTWGFYWEELMSIHDRRWEEVLEEVSIQVGLFQDHELLLWYDQGTTESPADGAFVNSPCWYLPQETALPAGHTYSTAVVLTDAYGRHCVYPGTTWLYDEDDGYWIQHSDFFKPDNFGSWVF